MNQHQNQPLKLLFRAPWADQPVRPFVRWLAWVVVGLGTLSVALGVYFSLLEGIPREDIHYVVLAFLGVTYMILLFGRAAYTGRAPRGWLPWS